MKSKTQSIGTKAEQDVILYLESNNFKILEKNFQWKYGELDIIAQHQQDNSIHFIEVKKRNYIPEELQEILPYHKIQALKRTAQYYTELNNFDETNISFQFDLVIVNETELSFFENIFELNF